MKRDLKRSFLALLLKWTDTPASNRRAQKFRSTGFADSSKHANGDSKERELSVRIANRSKTEDSVGVEKWQVQAPEVDNWYVGRKEEGESSEASSWEEQAREEEKD